MPRGRGKGGNKRKRGKNMAYGEKRELQYKTEGQDYGQILRMLGQGRLEVQCFDEAKTKRIASIRGKLRNRVWMGAGDLILVSIREEDEAKADVIHKYYPEEAMELQELKEIPENVTISMVADSDEENEMEMDADNDGDSGDDEENDKNKKMDDDDIDDI